MAILRVSSDDDLNSGTFFQSFGLFCLELANMLEGSHPRETLEALREVAGIEERGEVRARLLCVS
jgi:hypothetical protein